MVLSIADYSTEWPEQFARTAAELRRALGDLALRIDHIGSTAVPGLAAKPIVDLQVSVASLDPVAAYREQIESCGFAWRPDNPERTKRYFREVPPRPRTHLHVRRHGSFSEQFALLFRDYLRTHNQRAAAYARLKRQLAHLLITDPQGYVDAKDPFIWDTMRLADSGPSTPAGSPAPATPDPVHSARCTDRRRW